jgi:hypothetical protein
VRGGRARSSSRAATTRQPSDRGCAAPCGQTRPCRARPSEPPGARSSPKPGLGSCTLEAWICVGPICGVPRVDRAGIWPATPRGRGCSFTSSGSPGDPGEAAALVLVVQASVANDGARAPGCCIAAADRQSRPGWSAGCWRSRALCRSAAPTLLLLPGRLPRPCKRSMATATPRMSMRSCGRRTSLSLRGCSRASVSRLASRAPALPSRSGNAAAADSAWAERCFHATSQVSRSRRSARPHHCFQGHPVS